MRGIIMGRSITEMWSDREECDREECGIAEYDRDEGDNKDEECDMEEEREYAGGL